MRESGGSGGCFFGNPFHPPTHSHASLSPPLRKAARSADRGPPPVRINRHPSQLDMARPPPPQASHHPRAGASRTPRSHLHQIVRSLLPPPLSTPSLLTPPLSRNPPLPLNEIQALLQGPQTPDELASSLLDIIGFDDGGWELVEVLVKERNEVGRMLEDQVSLPFYSLSLPTVLTLLSLFLSSRQLATRSLPPILISC